MREVKRLQSILRIPKGRKEPDRRLEQPNHTQEEVLRAFAHAITPGGVFQNAPT